MADKLPELLTRLVSKINILTERFTLVKQQRDEALNHCEELKAKVESLESNLQSARTEIEYLRISHKIAPTQEDSQATQLMLATMIKKIDKCIAKLRND